MSIDITMQLYQCWVRPRGCGRKNLSFKGASPQLGLDVQVRKGEERERTEGSEEEKEIGL